MQVITDCHEMLPLAVFVVGIRLPATANQRFGVLA